jgi:hypothetical protein
MGFVRREIDRIRVAILAEGDGPQRPALYAAQQALEWTIEPNGVRSPFDLVMGTPVAQGDCPAECRPPRS